MAHSKYKTILFDLDGTLIDSKCGILSTLRIILDEYNIPYTEDAINQMIGPPFRVGMREVLGLKDADLIEELIFKYRKLYQNGGWRDCTLYDGVVEMLTSLDKMGYTLGIATSKPLQYTILIMKELGIDKFFKHIGGATGDSSSELKKDVIKGTLTALGVIDYVSVLMIGDRLHDIDGAREVGVDSMGILWGYGDIIEHKSHGATYIISTPQDVVKFLA